MDVQPVEIKTQEEGWAADEKRHQLLNMVPTLTSFTSQRQQGAVSSSVIRWRTGLAEPEYTKQCHSANNQ